jgi:hypothetical protein
MHGNVGVEQKMICFRKGPMPLAYGQRLMHPSATRAFRIGDARRDADEVMRDVLGQYAELLERHRQAVQAASGSDEEVELRMGWLLWEPGLREFLYFEEAIIPPNPDDYRAIWKEHKRKGRRLDTTNLWIYEKATDVKRYSITNEAGAKVQPYFDVPSVDDPNVHLFTIVGERVDDDRVRMWLTRKTVDELAETVGSLDLGEVSEAVIAIAEQLAAAASEEQPVDVTVVPVEIRVEAYERLTQVVTAVNDDHLIRQMLEKNKELPDGG